MSFSSNKNVKKLLIICTDKHKKQYSYELSFYGSKFLHLTGMKIAKDSRTLTENVLRVVAVFRKEDSSEFYEELTYLAKGLALESVGHPKVKEKTLATV